MRKKNIRDKNLASYYFDISLNLNPNYEQAMLNKSRVFILEGNIKSAKKMLNKIKSIYPKNIHVNNLLNQIDEIK